MNLWATVVAVSLMTAVAWSAVAAEVDLNTATKSQLMSIGGIGAKKADAILAYRDKNGGFKSLDELAKVNGFGAKSAAKLKPQLTLSPLKKPNPPIKPSKTPAAKDPASTATAKEPLRNR